MSYVYCDPSGVPSDFVCQICTQPWDPAAALCCPRCHAVFDAACVADRCMKMRQCPSSGCGEVWPEGEALPTPHRTVLSLADETVVVRCPHHRRGCEWTGPRSAAGPHAGGCARAPPPMAYADEIPADLTCAVCHGAMVHPTMPRGCGHVACGACLAAVVERLRRCPVCTAPTEAADVVEAPKIIAAACDRLVVICGNEGLGCVWRGPRSQFAQHMKTCSPVANVAPPAPPAPSPEATPKVPKSEDAKRKRTRLQIVTDPSTIRPGCADPQHVTAMVTLTAPTADTSTAKRLPVSLILAVDTSRSMQGKRLSLVIDTIEFILQEMNDMDELGVISFDTTVRTVLKLTRVTTEKEKAEARRTVMMGLQAEGATHLSGGLLNAIEQQLAAAAANPTVDLVRAVFLFTDGQANCGITKTPELLAALDSATRQRPRVSVYTFGFGADPNADMLRAISEASQGVYCFIDREEEFREAFANALGGLMAIALRDIALSVAISVEGDGAAKITAVRTRYPHEKKANSVVISVAELFCEERRDFLVEIDFVTSKLIGNESPVICTSLTCRNVVTVPANVEAMSAEAVISLSGEPPLPTPPEVDAQRQRWAVVEAIEQTAKAATGKQLDEARRHVQSAKVALERTPLPPQERQMLATELDGVEQALASQSVWSAQGQHFANEAVQRHAYQRCTGAVSRAETYAVPAHKVMRQKAKK